jgi:anion-transporting  ArsA/GET3 family ATPase
MTLEAERSLLDKQLVIVSGKGGTGKTTVSAALALAAQKRGKRVLAVEVGPHEHLPQLIDRGGAPVGYAGRELRPGLHAMRIDPFEAMAEYLGLQLGSKGLVQLGLKNKPLRQLLEGAPGWRELITLGKIWHLQQMRDPAGAPLYEMIIVDAPATGHGVTFLDVPRVVHSAVSAGPLSRNASLVEEMIRDTDQTLLLPVSLAEELPTQESAEFVQKVRDELGIAVDRIVVNAVAQSPFPPGLDALPEQLEALPGDLQLEALPSAEILARCAHYLASRFALNQKYVGEIAERTQLPVVTLPLLAQGLRGEGALDRLADALTAEPTRPSANAPTATPEREARPA